MLLLAPLCQYAVLYFSLILYSCTPSYFFLLAFPPTFPQWRRLREAGPVGRGGASEERRRLMDETDEDEDEEEEEEEEESDQQEKGPRGM